MMKKFLKDLKRLSNAERLAVIEEASRLIREELKTRKNGKEDAILDVAGCLSGPAFSSDEIERALYGE